MLQNLISQRNTRLSQVRDLSQKDLDWLKSSFIKYRQSKSLPYDHLSQQPVKENTSTQLNVQHIQPVESTAKPAVDISANKKRSSNQMSSSTTVKQEKEKEKQLSEAAVANENNVSVNTKRDIDAFAKPSKARKISNESTRSDRSEDENQLGAMGKERKRLANLTVKEIQGELKKAGLSTKGLKPELINRLLDHFQEHHNVEPTQPSEEQSDHAPGSNIEEADTFIYGSDNRVSEVSQKENPTTSSNTSKTSLPKDQQSHNASKISAKNQEEIDHKRELEEEKKKQAEEEEKERRRKMEIEEAEAEKKRKEEIEMAEAEARRKAKELEEEAIRLEKDKQRIEQEHIRFLEQKKKAEEEAKKIETEMRLRAIQKQNQLEMQTQEPPAKPVSQSPLDKIKSFSLFGQKLSSTASTTAITNKNPSSTTPNQPMAPPPLPSLSATTPSKPGSIFSKKPISALFNGSSAATPTHSSNSVLDSSRGNASHASFISAAATAAVSTSRVEPNQSSFKTILKSNLDHVSGPSRIISVPPTSTIVESSLQQSSTFSLLDAMKAEDNKNISGSFDEDNESQQQSHQQQSRAEDEEEEECNYIISDKEDSDEEISEEEDDGDDKPKKNVPNWARGVELRQALERQYKEPHNFDPDKIFPEIRAPDLETIFDMSKRKKKVRPRGSSAQWHHDDLTAMEKEEWRKEHGLKPLPTLQEEELSASQINKTNSIIGAL